MFTALLLTYIIKRVIA